jgi:predicted XRE-type DNA-binding protein
LQSRLAEHFGVTRQRVSQIVRQELAHYNADSR